MCTKYWYAGPQASCASVAQTNKCSITRRHSPDSVRGLHGVVEEVPEILAVITSTHCANFARDFRDNIKRDRDETRERERGGREREREREREKLRIRNFGQEKRVEWSN